MIDLESCYDQQYLHISSNSPAVDMSLIPCWRTFNFLKLKSSQEVMSFPMQCSSV